MDQAVPLALSWPQVSSATGYDIYLGTSSNAVASAATNTTGIYQGRTSALALNISSLQPNTTYYWRVDSVAANGTPAIGILHNFTTGSAVVDLMEDTWVAADSLNRSLPGLADCGSPRTNRLIGMFYLLWQNTQICGSGTNWDVSKYISTHPYTNPHNPWADNPIFQTVNHYYYWGQPELGYYNPNDPWMLRRQIALLSHAGIDVLIFDYSNDVTYDTQLYALCDMIRQMRYEGYKINFKISFLTHTDSGVMATYLYNTLYAPGKYSDLWFYWQGKPVILGEIGGNGTNDVVPSAIVQNFFTWRTSWVTGDANPVRDEWQLGSPSTPQGWGYDTRIDLPEQVCVETIYSANYNTGKSHSNNLQQDYDNYDLPIQHTTRLGTFFKEQMNYGQKYDPQFLFVTTWNEWISSSYIQPTYCYTHFLADCAPVNSFFFIDLYNEEYNGDIEPMKGGYTDNYYFQMAAQNRLRKGVRPVPPASAPQTINLAGSFSQWNSVGPNYYDPVNDTVWRNYPAAIPSQMGIYTNTSGRNDLTVMKVARDANNFYFLAQCNSNITSYTGSNWMVLFIDADQNHLTGWEGYDYAVNLGGVGLSTTTLFQNKTTTNGWTWTPVRSDITYTLSGNQLMLAVPRASLGLASDPVQFDFHWADNFQTNDIADFGVDGDSAPDRRFNYRYITSTNTEVVLLSDDFENGKQSMWSETWTNGSLWSLTTASPYTGNTCAVANYASTGQSNLIARVSTAGYGSFRLNFHYKLTNVVNAQKLQISYLTTNGWVPIRQLSRDEYYPTAQTWSYDERQNVWLNFVDRRYNSGPDARFFTTNFAFRVDASALTTNGQSVFIDAVALTAYTQLPAVIPAQAWQTQDIGNAGNAGYFATNGTTFTVSGSGLDIGNNGDAFRFFYQTHSGDGQMTARLTSMTATNPWAKAGVMIRESLDTGARNALMALAVSNSLIFQNRAVPLGTTTLTSSGSGIVPPYWVGVVRAGNNFTGYASVDGANWTQIGSTNLSGFNSTALWGLAVTAHDNFMTNVAAFDSVPAVQSPAILTQPQSQFIEPGTNMSFSVSAIGDQPLQYYWQKNRINMTDGGNTQGSTNATLLIGNTSSSDAGLYSVVVSNAYGSVTSVGAFLAMPVMEAIGQNFGFEKPSVGRSFQTDPAGAIWTFNSGSGISGNDTAFTSGNPNAPEGVQVGYVQGLGIISQSMNFAQNSYQVIFSAAQRANITQAGQTFNVMLDGQMIGTYAPPESPINYLDYRTSVFTVTNGSHTLAFVGTDSNGGDNTIFLDNVRIIGMAPLQLFTVGFSTNGGFQMSIQGQPGQTYTLQASTDLVNWVSLLSFTCTNSPMVVVDPGAKYYSRRFYRLAQGTLLIPASPIVLGFSLPQPWSSNGLSLMLQGPTNTTYQIQASTNLLTWLSVTNVLNTNSPFLFHDPDAKNYKQRFYRAVLQ